MAILLDCIVLIDDFHSLPYLWWPTLVACLCGLSCDAMVKGIFCDDMSRCDIIVRRCGIETSS